MVTLMYQEQEIQEDIIARYKPTDEEIRNAQRKAEEKLALLKEQAKGREE